jgi:hypothetical protein
MVNKLAKKYHIYFPQVLTHKNITKMSRKMSRTYGKFLGIFYEKIWTDRGVISKKTQTH